MPPRAPLRRALPLTLLALAAPLVARDAPAATGYACGDGKPNLATKKCDCPPGKVESTNAKGNSTCVDPPRPAPTGVASAKPSTSAVAKPKPAPSASASASASKCPAGMVAVPAGSFPLDETKQTMNVGALCIDVNEVTVSDFSSCVASNGCAMAAVWSADPKLPNQSCNLGRAGRALHPMNCLTWEEASTYCSWARKRLPTDEEWEWVARNGAEATRYPWGAAALDETRANVCGVECPPYFKAFVKTPITTEIKGDDGFVESSPVGSFPKGANRLGVNDLAGNVWEWTSTSEVAPDGSSQRIIRGGGFLSPESMMVLSGTRGIEKPAMRTWQIGLRCAKSL